MTDAAAPLVTICIPHWQVRELVTICLRALRKFTATVPIEVMVVDNGSQDESLDYLRGVKWIRLIERGKSTPANWLDAFVTALDLGFAESHSPFFIIMHTDTIVKHPQWLERLLRPMEQDPLCAAAGAWKLEKPRPVYELVKKITDTKKAKLWLQRNLLGDQNARQLPRELCPRDYCTLYRAAPIREFGLRFNEREHWPRYTAGEKMFYQLKAHGYHAEVLPAAEMMRYMEHLAHATAGLRPEQRSLHHRRAQRKSQRNLQRFFNAPLVQALARDDCLDG